MSSDTSAGQALEILRRCPTPALCSDTAGRILDINPALGALLGGDTFGTISAMLPALQDPATRLADAAAAGAPFTVEDARGVFQLNVAPSPTGYVVFLQAVSEAEQLRRAVQASYDRLDEIQALANMGSWSWDVRADRVTWTRQLYRIYGLDANTFEASFGGYLSRVHPDDRERVQQILQKVLAEQDSFHFEERVVRPDGDVRILVSRGRVWRSPEGAPLRLTGVCHDVTAERRTAQEAERALLDLVTERAARSEAETLLKRVSHWFQKVPAMVGVVSGPGHAVELTNPALTKLLGPARPGRPLAEVYPALARQGLESLLDRVASSGEAYTGHEVPADIGEGEQRSRHFFDVTCQPIEGGGSNTSILVHAHDVTDRVRARQELERRAADLQKLTEQLQQSNMQLERSNRELDQFAYVASHDLKAPLRAIGSLAQWLDRDLQPVLTDESREHLSLLRGRVTRMQDLIEGLLDFSRAGRIRSSVQEIDVAALSRELFQFLGAPERVRLELGDLPTIRAEAVPFRQVLLNLLSNAIKYSRSTVAISAERQSDYWAFRVRDDGPGIHPDHQDAIWGLFHTLEPRDEGGGTGIGLAVIKRIVEERGHRVTVRSAPGEGAEFIFGWPTQEANA